MFQVHVTIDPEFTAAVRGLADAIAGHQAPRIEGAAAPAAPPTTGKRHRAAASSASAPAPAPAPAPASSSGDVTRDQVKTAAVAYAETHGRPAALAILQEFGASSIPTLDPKHFADVLAKFQA